MGHGPRVGLGGDRSVGAVSAAQRLVEFVFQSASDTVEEQCRLGLQLGAVDDVVIEESWEHQSEQVAGDVGDGGLGGQVDPVQMVDAPMTRIAREQGVGDLGDRELHGATMAEIPQLGQPRENTRTGWATVLRCARTAGLAESLRRIRSGSAQRLILNETVWM